MPAAHTVARGHVRLDRPAIVPNDPAPPDPLDGLVRDVFAHVNGVLLLIEFVKHFGYALSYEQIAIILYGDTPALPSPPAPEPPKSARPDLDRVRALFVALHTSPETQAKKLGEMGCERLEELTTTQAAQLIERMDKALKAKTAEATSATTAA